MVGAARVQGRRGKRRLCGPPLPLLAPTPAAVNPTTLPRVKPPGQPTLQGSNREYLEDLEKMFWAAPTSTAAYRGVRPRVARAGSRGPERRTREKKTTPVTSRTVGVMRAAMPQPNLEKIQREMIIMVKVTAEKKGRGKGGRGPQQRQQGRGASLEKV